jgi:hypothetical protein
MNRAKVSAVIERVAGTDQNRGIYLYNCKANLPRVDVLWELEKLTESGAGLGVSQ